MTALCVGAVGTGSALGLLTRWSYGLAATLLVACWLVAGVAAIRGLARAVRAQSAGKLSRVLAPIIVPVRLAVRLAVLPFRPRKWVYELSRYCLICGRPLTSRRSQQARVGSTCIKRYGSRAKRVLNPAYVQWQQQRRRRSATDALVFAWPYGMTETPAVPATLDTPRRSGATLFGVAVLAWLLLVVGFALTATSPGT